MDFLVGANTRNVCFALQMKNEQNDFKYKRNFTAIYRPKTFTCFKPWNFRTKLMLRHFVNLLIQSLLLVNTFNLNISKTKEMKRVHLDDVKMELNQFFNNQLKICVDDSKTSFLFHQLRFKCFFKIFISFFSFSILSPFFELF